MASPMNNLWLYSYYEIARKRYKFLYFTDNFIVSQLQSEGFIQISVHSHFQESSLYLIGDGDKVSFVTARRK